MLQFANLLTPLDIMLGLLAAAAHDVDHPGVNQPFLIKTKHHLASLYQVRPTFILLGVGGFTFQVQPTVSLQSLNGSSPDVGKAGVCQIVI